MHHRPIAAAIIVAFLIGVAGPSPALGQASADDLKKAEALATEGKVYFRTKLFDKAADKFMQAFGISKAPALVYNAARAYEEAGKLAESIAMFQHYSTLSNATAKGRSAAQKKIVELQARKAAEDEARRRDQAAKAQKKPAKPAPNPAKSASKPVAQPRKTVPKHPVGSREMPLWRAIGSGTALLFAGAAYANAYRVATDVLPVDVIDETTAAEYRANQSSARVWQAVSISSAAIGIGVGLWAGWDWWKSGQPQPKVTILPSVGRREIVARWTF